MSRHRGGSSVTRAHLKPHARCIRVDGTFHVRDTVQPVRWIKGDLAMIARGLDGGAMIDSLAGGRRPLNWAAISKQGSAVRLLLARGAGINLRNATGFTPEAAAKKP